MEQGPKSQATSRFCSGGVSAVMGTSDVDVSTFASADAAGNQLSCSLPFEWNRPSLNKACLDHFRFEQGWVKLLQGCGLLHGRAPRTFLRRTHVGQGQWTLIRTLGLDSVALVIRPAGCSLILLLVAAGFLGLLWLTQVLVRRNMDDGDQA